MSDVTRILSAIEHGDPSAADQLLPLVYDELRKLAAQKLAQEKPGQTLQATALLHEAYLRLVDVDQSQHWDSRGHFFAAAAEAMRRILVENARRKGSRKGGGGLQRRELEDVEATFNTPPEDLLALDDALTKLQRENQPAADLAKLRLFGGLTADEAADSLGISRRSGFRLWTYARAFLQADLADDPPSQSD
jgi:RNA polymerase sigma factor (TIGR02999 family)